ncbi:hypothetical protein GOBAR_DD32507 [Gossypium barbadense]|nr:hypothetical protein GOBAR_DD32507 [Gossypium barbadense]
MFKVSSRQGLLESEKCANLSKNLMSITGMSEQWVAAWIKQKRDSKCVPWRSLKDAILTHPNVRKRLDVFALSIYGLVVFPKALGHVDEAVTDLFDRLDKRVTPISTILAETFKSLSACRKAGEGRFIGCAQLLLAWFHSHFWKVDKVSYRVFSENYSPLKEIVATLRRYDISEEKWMYKSRQFIPVIQGITNYEFSYRDDGYRKKIQEMSSAWKQTRRMKRLAVGPMTTPEYNEWWVRRINDNVPKISQENSQSIEEYLRVVPSKLEIIKQDFERRNTNLEKKKERMEEEKTNLRLDIDIQKLKTKKLRKEKNKAEEELGSLKLDYKKLHLSIRTAGLGKTSEQWLEEIREENDKADRWERKFQEMQMRNEALEKSLLDSQREKSELKDRVTELERSLHQYRNRNAAIELKASLSKIEEMKKRIEELETVLQNCEIQIKYLKANESHNKEQLHYFQSQVRSRDHLMEEAVVQIRGVADHMQTLAVQADMLSVKYELELGQGQELALLLRRIRVLGTRVKSYL